MSRGVGSSSLGPDDNATLATTATGKRVRDRERERRGEKREIKSDCVQPRHMAARRRLGAGNGVRTCISRGVSVHERRLHPDRRADSRRCHMPSSAKPYGSSCATRLSRWTTQQRAVSLYSAQRAVRTYSLYVYYTVRW